MKVWDVANPCALEAIVVAGVWQIGGGSCYRTCECGAAAAHMHGYSTSPSLQQIKDDSIAESNWLVAIASGDKVQLSAWRERGILPARLINVMGKDPEHDDVQVIATSHFRSVAQQSKRGSTDGAGSLKWAPRSAPGLVQGSRSVM